jgi:hypothetical protein
LSNPFVLALAAGGPRQQLLLAGTAAGIGLSRDGGASWALVADPRTHVQQNAVAASADGRTLYAGGSSLWRSTDGGASWTPVPAELGVEIFTVAMVPSGVLVGTANHLYLAPPGGQAFERRFPVAGGFPLIDLLARWGHYLGLALWLGSLVLSLWLWIPPTQRGQVSRLQWRRFWALNGGGLVLLILTGVYLNIFETPALGPVDSGAALEALRSTVYGQVLLSKHALIVLLLGAYALAAWRRPRRLVRAGPLRYLGPGAGSTVPGAALSGAWLFVLLLLALLIVGFGASLGVLHHLAE